MQNCFYPMLLSGIYFSVQQRLGVKNLYFQRVKLGSPGIAEEILKLYPDQKAIITSGFSESDDVKATFQLGAAGFIKKPYSMAQLSRAVQEALTN
jgi:DNA-binding NarL/FixJ family response regulator